MNALNKGNDDYELYEQRKQNKELSDIFVTFVDGLSFSNRYIDWSYIRVHNLFHNKNSSVFTLRLSDNPAGGKKEDYKNKIGVYMSKFGVLGESDNVDIKKGVKTSRKSDSKEILTSKELYNRIGLLRWAEKCGLTYNDDSSFSFYKPSINDLKKETGGNPNDDNKDNKGFLGIFIFIVLFIMYRIFKKK